MNLEWDIFHLIPDTFCIKFSNNSLFFQLEHGITLIDDYEKIHN